MQGKARPTLSIKTPLFQNNKSAMFQSSNQNTQTFQEKIRKEIQNNLKIEFQVKLKQEIETVLNEFVSKLANCGNYNEDRRLRSTTQQILSESLILNYQTFRDTARSENNPLATFRQMVTDIAQELAQEKDQMAIIGAALNQFNNHVPKENKETVVTVKTTSSIKMR